MSALRETLFGLFEGLRSDEQPVWVPHRAELRASSIGRYCPRDHVLTAWATKAGTVPLKPWKLGASLYTSIGTVSHSTIQQYLGLAQILWGSWECLSCGKIWLNSLSPGLCCGALVDYIEYSLIHPSPHIGEFGHVDGIAALPHGLGYLPIEIKTSGESTVDDRRKNGPLEEHHKQGSVYHAMLSRGYGVVRKRSPPEPGVHRGKVQWDKKAKFPGRLHNAILFIYVRRDKPRPRNWIPLLRKPLPGQLEYVEEVAPVVRSGIKSGKLPEGRCKSVADATSPYDWKDVCPWAHSVCFCSRPKTAAAAIFAKSKEKRAPVVAQGSKPSFINRKE